MTPFVKAFSIHILTATGAALALMAMLAAGRGDWPMMFLWLLFAFLVDGIDGPLARRVDVARNAPQWDGVLLDLIVDYLTYVIIPAYAMVEAELIGPGWSLAAGLMICVTGAVYFADTRMKTEDKSFSGFPACWNMVILVLFAVDIGSWGAMLLMMAIALAQFFPLKFIHPVRTRRWRALNLPMVMLWAAAATWEAWLSFDAPATATALLLVSTFYLSLAGIAQQLVQDRAA
ncbi:phosphatidylcholine synthase [Halovulum dunhuangense]|uniref:Phosphatidylcholine synthase n=1 Tax=Halovulum dunhuangense TaxID=1505036 RepID=A0A849KYY8_9RHOB|nr:CDP-alcohol phosphatidyltransferase family protein [Halovulum dunhuangense]NNU79586.1 phosphatidylcholine synthase [Halovulum dunhuangense]